MRGHQAGSSSDATESADAPGDPEASGAVEAAEEEDDSVFTGIGAREVGAEGPGVGRFLPESSLTESSGSESSSGDSWVFRAFGVFGSAQVKSAAASRALPRSVSWAVSQEPPRGLRRTSSLALSQELPRPFIRTLPEGLFAQIWLAFFPSFFCNLLGAVAGLSEYRELFYFSGLYAISLQPAYSALQQLLCYFPIAAFASSASSAISQELKEGRPRPANVYLNHMLLVGAVWSVLAAACFGGAYRQLSAFATVSESTPDDLGHQYLLITFLASPILLLFSTALSPILKVEKRGLLEFSRQACLQILSLLLMFIFMYGFGRPSDRAPGDGKGMVALALAYVVSNGLVAVWMIAAFWKGSPPQEIACDKCAPAVRSPFRSKLHISVRRLFPIRPKVIWRIVWGAVIQYCNMAQAQLVVLGANLQFGHYYKDQLTIAQKRTVSTLYNRYHFLACAIPLAFNQAFAKLVGPNLITGDYARAKRCIVACLAHSLVVSLVVDFSLAARADFLARLVAPYFVPEPSWYPEFLRDCGEKVVWSFVTPPFLTLSYMAQTLMQSEGRIALPLLLQLSRSIPAVVAQVSMSLHAGDLAPYTLTYPMADLCQSLLGLIVISRCWARYTLRQKAEEEAHVVMDRFLQARMLGVRRGSEVVALAPLRAGSIKPQRKGEMPLDEGMRTFLFADSTAMAMESSQEDFVMEMVPSVIETPVEGGEEPTDHSLRSKDDGSVSQFGRIEGHPDSVRERSAREAAPVAGSVV